MYSAPDDPPEAPALPDDLNDPQRRAVAHVDGPLLIFAGAYQAAGWIAAIRLVRTR